MDSREVLRRLEADGWHIDRVKGSHHQLRHPVKPGVVTVPHPKKDLKPGTLHGIEKQAGIRLR
ncbi:MAG: type II toxin-antitoxin system HicA family toxin [Deltaproteobacteria bacterium]